MDFSISQVVRYGPRAGQPRQAVDVLQEKNALTRRALAVLKRNGFAVLSVLLNVGEAPNIKVLPNAATKSLKDDALATDYGKSPGCTHWQAWLDGVRVVWTERESAS